MQLSLYLSTTQKNVSLFVSFINSQFKSIYAALF
jgi:hypothetical protein